MKFRLTLGGWNYRLVIHDGDLLLETVTFQALARIVNHLHAVYDKHPDRWFCRQLVEHCTLRFHNLFSYHSPWWHQDISYKQSEHHRVATVWVYRLSLLSIWYELANNISVQLWAEDTNNYVRSTTLETGKTCNNNNKLYLSFISSLYLLLQ